MRWRGGGEELWHMHKALWKSLHILYSSMPSHVLDYQQNMAFTCTDKTTTKTRGILLLLVWIEQKREREGGGGRQKNNSEYL